MARFGFAARALVYMLVGVLAAMAAVGAGRRATDAHGAIRAMGRQPFGPTLLFVVGLGLAAYAVWRFVQAGLDLDGKGRDLDGLIARAGFVVSGLVHAGLAYTCFSLAVGLRRGRSYGVRVWATRLMDEPFGRWMVGAAGLAVIGSGVYQFYKAYARKYQALMGWFLLHAALDVDPHEARGMAGALRELERQDHGPWLLAAVAVGLTAYGALSLVDARYRRIT
ncbi:MAG: hypothetical protein DMF78_24985 [Acidobacteria bacterium]|nr:MAG: hypothetical protein DMF78_24985 [Acidobacteriota bacterium]